MRHEIALLAALRLDDLEARARACGERFAQQLLLLDLMGQKDELRRRLVVVELGQEGAEHLGIAQAGIGLRKIGAVAPILEVAEEEGLDAEMAGLAGEREDIRLLGRLRIDVLARLDRRERGDSVAQPRGALELESVGRLLHLGAETRAHGPALAREKIAGLGDELLIGRVAHLARARPGAALDLEQEAGPGAIVVEGIRAGPQEEGALQRIQGAVHGPDAGEGAVIIAWSRAGAAVLGDL